MDNGKLLDALAKEGFLSSGARERLAEEAERTKKRVEDVIYEERLVPAGKVAEIKSALLGVPYQVVRPDALTPKLKSLIPEETVRTYKVVPLQAEKELFVAGMVDPDDLKAQEALKFVARRNRMNLGIYLISHDDWQAALTSYSPYQSDIESALRGLDAEGGARKLVELEKGETGTVEAPVIRIVSDTLRAAVEAKASDIHIEPQERYLRVRFRIDGVLRETAKLPAGLAASIVSRIKVISNLKIDETRIPQDGRFRTKIFDREIDFRVSTFPTPLGEKAAIRVLDPGTGLRTLGELGLIGKNRDLLERALEKPYGMILITGPTGSGKTTTLYAILQILNKERANIVSLEDPVEYFVPGVNQSQVQPEIGYDFASGLRQLLRQDPDVILVGEIRDIETAGLAVHAALTGHVMLSTLHTNNAVGAIPRLIDMKVEPYLLPSALTLVVAQRLVSLLCNECKKPEEVSPAIGKIIKKALAELPPEARGAYQEPYTVYRSSGCVSCHNTGFSGRIALFEMFPMSPKVEEVILSIPTAQKLFLAAREEGMITLREDGVLKALKGTVSIEEVLRESEEV